MLDVFWNVLYGNPLYYVGLLLAFWAAIGFLTFVRGFFSGVPHLFTYDGDDEYLSEHRVRAFWGPAIILSAWGTWELVRWISMVFSGTNDAFSFWFILLLTIFIWLPPLWKWVGGLFKDGH